MSFICVFQLFSRINIFSDFRTETKQSEWIYQSLNRKLLPSSAQAPAQLSWAELVLILFPPAPARPPGWPPGRTSSEIIGNQQNLLSNNCSSTPVEHETAEN